MTTPGESLHCDGVSPPHVDRDGARFNKRGSICIWGRPMEGIMLQDPVALAAALWALAVIIAKLTP